MDTPPAARADAAEFLDVDVDQIAGLVVFVAADHDTGRPVHPREAIHPVTHQYRVHCRGRHPELAGDTGRPELLGRAELDDLRFDPLGGLVRAVVGSARAIEPPFAVRVLGMAPDPLVAVGRDTFISIAT